MAEKKNINDIKTITENLSKPLPMDAIDWRVQSIKKTTNGVGMIVLGYKDARVDMNRLDAVTQGAWQTDYKRDSKGVLQCGIGIYCTLPGTNQCEWVWKYSNGIESFSDSEKGEYSDAFKRAGFMWGIGRELYDLPFIWINLNEGEYYSSNGKIRNKINPNEFNWYLDDGLLSCTDKNGNVRFKERKLNKYTQAKTNKVEEKPQPKEVKKTAPKADKADEVLEKHHQKFLNLLASKPTMGVLKGAVGKALTEYKISQETLKEWMTEGGVKDDAIEKLLS